MERIVERMQHEKTGVSVRTVKSFLSKIPSVFAGADLIAWMIKNLDVDDQGEWASNDSGYGNLAVVL